MRLAIALTKMTSKVLGPLQKVHTELQLLINLAMTSVAVYANVMPLKFGSPRLRKRNWKIYSYKRRKELMQNSEHKAYQGSMTNLTHMQSQLLLLRRRTLKKNLMMGYLVVHQK